MAEDGNDPLKDVRPPRAPWVYLCIVLAVLVGLALGFTSCVYSHYRAVQRAASGRALAHSGEADGSVYAWFFLVVGAVLGLRWRASDLALILGAFFAALAVATFIPSVLSWLTMGMTH